MNRISPLCHNDTFSPREVLRAAAGAAVSCVLGGSIAVGEANGSQQPFLLSDQGCGRATGYAEANKIVTHNDRTHVAWLDSPTGEFRVRVRTLDHTTHQWSPTYTIGHAHDNHGGPALTIDGDGFLHVVFIYAGQPSRSPAFALVAKHPTCNR